MSALPDHLEAHLGEIEAGWSVDDEGRPVDFHVVRCPWPGAVGRVAFSTLGLSAFELTMGSSGRRVRQELVMLARDEWRAGPMPSILQQVGRDLVASGTALLRGDVVGPRGALVEGTALTALYASIPVALADSFAQCGGIVFVWLMPISSAEAALVRSSGWERFEQELERHDPDLTDLRRASTVRSW